MAASLAVFVLAAVGLALPPLLHAAPAAQPRVILVLGDSLSAGYGVRRESSWVALLQHRLNEQGYGYRVVNASVSGETSGGARSRLPRALELHRPAVLILELGSNDGLRGLPLAQMRSNLSDMIDKAQAAGAAVVLIGMRMPPNYGAIYADGFHALYGELAKQHQTPLVDFLLEGVALDPQLMQADDIHPNAAAQPRLLENVWPALRKVIKK